MQPYDFSMLGQFHVIYKIVGACIIQQHNCCKCAFCSFGSGGKSTGGRSSGPDLP